MLRTQQQDWEDLGSLDPLWAILTEDDKRGGQWDFTAFFARGELDFRPILENARRLGYPRRFTAALDFGCGVGRVTRAMSHYFEECCGIDISESMVRQARKLVSECEFKVGGLEGLPADYFDLIYCVLVLQHQPTRRDIFGYLREFVRVLAPGGILIFQLPSRLGFRTRIQARRRLYSVLRAAGVKPDTLMRAGLNPMRMTCVPQHAVEAFLDSLNTCVVAVRPDNWAGPNNQSRTYYVTKLRAAKAPRNHS